MPCKQKKYHYIYKTTCLVTGKFYVGMHSTDDLEDGYLGSGKILGYSRKKYGDENHKQEILEMLPSREALKAREKEIVNEALLANPLNINLKYGGDGGSIDGWKTLKPETRIKACKNGGKSFVEKYGAGWNLPQVRAKSIDARKNRDLGYNAHWVGRKMTDAHKSKIGKANMISQSGSKNSQFGTCWVTNGKPVKIKKEQLDEYLANGYTRGRK